MVAQLASTIIVNCTASTTPKNANGELSGSAAKRCSTAARVVATVAELPAFGKCCVPARVPAADDDDDGNADDSDDDNDGDNVANCSAASTTAAASAAGGSAAGAAVAVW